MISQIFTLLFHWTTSVWLCILKTSIWLASHLHLCIQIPATSILLHPEGKWCSFGSQITDDIMAPIQLLAACAAILSVPILCISHSGVIDDIVLPGLGILAWICFLNVFQCPGPLATSGSSPVFQFSNSLLQWPWRNKPPASPWNGKMLTAALTHQHLHEFAHLFFTFSTLLFCKLQAMFL